MRSTGLARLHACGGNAITAAVRDRSHEPFTALLNILDTSAGQHGC
ncbi:hypothetical protein ACIQGZ_20385 [Streptomyces sp. NPDC092296]